MIESIGLSLLFLPAFITYFWFLSNIYLKFSLNQSSLLLVFLLSAVVCYFLFWYRRYLKLYLPKPSAKLFIPILLLIFVLGLNAVLNWYWPVSTDFDAVVNYDYRAKVFYDQKQITGLSHQYLVSYPLFTSLGHTISYTLGFQNPKLFYSYLFFAFLLVFYAQLRKSVNSRLALVGCLLLATTPAVFHFSITAYTNFPYLAFLGGSFLYLSSYIRNPSKHKLLVYSLLLGFSAWVRPATHIFFVINLLLLVLLKRKIYWLPIVIYSLIFLPWWYFQQFMNSIATYEAVRVAQSLPVLLNSLSLVYYPVKAALDILLDLKYSGLTGLIFLYTLIRKFKPSPELLVLIVNFLVWLLLSLAIRAEYTDFHQWVSILYDSMQRLFIIFYPLIIIYILRSNQSNQLK